MISVLAPAVILLLYVCTIFFLQWRWYPGLLGVVLFAMAGYDWIFIEASYLLPGPLVALTKPYFEYLTAYLLFKLWQKDRNLNLLNPAIRHLTLLLLVPSLIIVVTRDLKSPAPFFDLFFGLRLFLLPVLLWFLLFRYGAFRTVSPTFILNSLVTAGVFFFVLGVLQRYGYNGDVRTLWFHDFFDRFPINPVRVGKANYVRNDELRVTGWFVSPIIQVVSLGIGVVVLAAKLVFQKASLQKRSVWVFLLLVLVYGQWRTYTRVGIIMDLLGIAVLTGSRLWPRLRAWMYVIPVAVVGLTFGTLLSGNVKEASALGRIQQYAEWAKRFRIGGLGFSHQFVSTYFDSYFITLTLLFGALVVFPLIFLWKLNRAAVRLLALHPRSVFLNATLAVSASFIYLFIFQYLAGSFPYRIYFLLLFYCWFAYETYLQNRFCPPAGRPVPADPF